MLIQPTSRPAFAAEMLRTTSLRQTPAVSSANTADTVRISQAAQTGTARMDLTTARTNKHAQALYESLGWVRDKVFFAYNRRVTQA